MVNALPKGGAMSEEKQQTLSRNSTHQDKSGWKLKAYYQAVNSEHDSLAYKNAIKKASSTDRQVMIRSYSKNNFTLWEVYEYC